MYLLMESTKQESEQVGRKRKVNEQATDIALHRHVQAVSFDMALLFIRRSAPDRNERGLHEHTLVLRQSSVLDLRQTPYKSELSAAADLPHNVGARCFL
ncbi:hypothetical protein J6590_083104 [Homalodisca vitripennis]|nr:hypothetical protein J6590_083104 [Homalodisca vitripennis]